MSNLTNVRTITDDFWKFASTTSGTYTLDDMFLSWAEKENLTLDQIKKAWVIVNTDVVEAFGLKNAAMTFTGEPEELADYVRLLQEKGIAPEDMPQPTINEAPLEKPNPMDLKPEGGPPPIKPFDGGEKPEMGGPLGNELKTELGPEKPTSMSTLPQNSEVETIAGKGEKEPLNLSESLLLHR